jgi:ABC-type Mn2+/Zn2+ transport system permease subunit
MSDFLAILSFSWIPLVGAFSFALTAAPLGAILSLRDEILLGLALPPVGAAAIVTAVWLGIPGTHTLLLYLVAVAGILLVSLIMPRKSVGASPRWRVAFLASVFCAGEAATLLVSSVSTSVEAHMQHMLRGELLAIGQSGLIGFGVLTAVVLSLAYLNRGSLFALAVDEEGLGIRNPRRAGRLLLGFRVLSAVVIAAGVIWVGPLLTIALLAVPCMFYERRARGLVRLMVGVAVIGPLSVLVGFGGSIAWDLPPAPVVVGALFAVGCALGPLARARRLLLRGI